MRQRLGRLACRLTAHDWWTLAYPPARRRECRRCGAVVEEAPDGTVVEQARRAAAHRGAALDLQVGSRREGADSSQAAGTP